MTVLRSGSATDVGQVRYINQDLALEQSNLFAVADGMGGHAGGEVAARVAIDTLQSAFDTQPSLDGLRRAVSEANAAVWRESLTQATLRGMGTTLTAAALVSGDDGRDVVALANVGDSRAYLYSGGRITQVTLDHSLAEEKVRTGELTEAEAAVHPHRHILTRALGVADDVAVDLWELHVRSGDRILLCSDGLTNEVGTNQLVEVLGNVADPAEAARVLVRTANEHGGNDNITVVVVDVVVGEEDSTTTVITPVGGARAASVVVASGPVADAATDAAPMGTTAVPPPAARDESPDDALTMATPMVTPEAPAPAADLTEALPAVDPDPVEAAATDTAAAVTAAAAPVAGAPATEVPPQTSFETAEPPRKESRRERRRRLGIPRRVTVRVVGFFLLVAALLVAAYFLVRWYANDNWYVTLKGNQIVIYQGQPGGVLWFKPKLVDQTGVNTDQVQFARLTALRAGVSEPSLSAARQYVQNLEDEFLTIEHANTTTSLNLNGGGPLGTLPSTTTTVPFYLPPGYDYGVPPDNGNGGGTSPAAQPAAQAGTGTSAPATTTTAAPTTTTTTVVVP